MTNFNIQSLAQLDCSRFAGYKANLDFYNGEQWTEKSDPSRRSGRQLVFNYAKIAIDKLTSYLTEGLNFACEPCGLFRRKPKLIFWTCLPAAASSSTLIISI
jgi:hypothetical protein